MGRFCCVGGRKPREYSGKLPFSLQIFTEILAKNVYIWVGLEATEGVLSRDKVRGD